MPTRRELLRNCAALVAGARMASAGAGRPWTPDDLGVFCSLGEDEKSARRVLSAARSAGFRKAQIFFPWNRVGPEYLRSLPAWLDGEGIQAQVLSAYVNCCSPDTVLMDCRREDFARALDAAGNLGCRHLAAWTGGYAAGLMQADARNFMPAALDAISRFLEPHLAALEKSGLTLALESYITLACPDAMTLRKLLDRLPACAGAVLDPPNLTPVSRYSQRDQVLREMMQKLENRIALVHLKDFRLAPGGAGYELPGPLLGEMNYPLYVEQILSLPPSLPVIAEHVPPAKFAETRRRLIAAFERKPA